MTPTINYQILIALSLFLFAFCSTSTPIVEVPEINMAVKPGISIPADASITMVSKLIGPDVTGAGGLITNRLMTHGFNVLSPSTSREAVIYNEQVSQQDEGRTEVRSEVYNMKEIHSGYVLEFEGRYYLDWIRLPRHYDFTSFTASLIDLGTGEILLSANFVGNKPVEEVCIEFVDMMVERIR